MALLRFVVHSVIACSAVLALACAPIVTIDDEGSESSADSTDGPTTVSTTTVGTTTVGTTTVGTTATTSTTSVTTVGTTPTTDPTIDPTFETDSDTESVPDCPSSGFGSGMVGEACTANNECESSVCRLFTDAPINRDAICDATPFDCSMLITGTSLDIVTRQPLAGYELRVASALQAATNPVGATSLAGAISGPDGRLEALTAGPPVEPIGLIALLEGPGFHLTGTGLAVPLDGSSYSVANDVHDLWLVSNDALAAWSAQLSQDPSIPLERLPLGPNGGVVGLVRDADGVPLAGATVTSTDAGSGAIVRYLANDGTFDSIATGDLGLFVLFEPALAEVFQAEIDGMPIGATAVLLAEDMIFAFTFTAP